MECRNIQEKLSAYIDNLLPAREKTAFDEHLKSCSECTAALADLRKTLECLSALDPVEPPTWMAQKIMTRVRSDARTKRSLFRKLFYPLHIKLPIEAVATVLVVGLALYIYRDIGPEVKLAKTPVEEAAPQVAPKDISPPSPLLTKSEQDEFEISKPSPTRPAEETAKSLPASPPFEKVGEVGFAEKKAMTGKMAEQALASKEADLKTDRLVQSRVPEAEKKEETKAPALAKIPEQMPAAGAVPKDEARQAAGETAPRAKLSYKEKKKKEQLSLTVFVKDMETAVTIIEKTLKELEGKSIRTESAVGKKVVSALLKANRLHELSEKLKGIGEIKEKALDMRDREDEVMVRLKVASNSQQP